MRLERDIEGGDVVDDLVARHQAGEGHAIADAARLGLRLERRNGGSVADEQQMELQPRIALCDQVDDAVERMPFADEAGEAEDEAALQPEAA